jgi:hypothetical protein
MATLRQMSDRVLTQAGLNQTAYRDEARSIVSDVYLELCLNLRFNTKTVTVALTAGQGDYSISGDFGLTDFLSLRTLIYTGSNLPYSKRVERTTPDELWSLRAITGSAAIFGGWVYAHEPNDLLMFYPLPQANDEVTIQYSARPDPLTDDTDEPTLLPLEFHYVIEDGAMERAVRYQKKPHQPSDIDRYRQRYRDGINAIRRWRNQAESANPRHAVVGRRTRPYAPRRDIYWTGDG